MRIRQKCRGMAMVLVVSVVAIAAVLGWAMLATAAVRSRTADNAAMAVQADRLAESAANLGVYLVKNPSLAGALQSTGTYSVSGLSLGDPSAGTFSLSIARRPAPDDQVFDVMATGTCGSGTAAGGGTALRGATQQAAAVLRQQKRFVLSHAVTTNVSLPVPAAGNITKGASAGPLPNISASAVSTTAALTIATGGIVNGDVRCASVSPLGSVSGVVRAADTGPIAPTFAQIKVYGPTYTHNGQTYTAQVLGSPLNAAPVATDPATNPLGIYYVSGDLAVLSTATGAASVAISGSVVVTGRVVVGASGNSAIRSMTITPAVGSPGLITGGEVAIAGPNKRLTVNGLLYTGGGINGSGATSSGTRITVNGAWLCFTGPLYSGTNYAIHPLYAGQLYVTYVPENVAIPDFTATTNQVNTGVVLARYGLASP